MMTKSEKTLITVCGPTASGKTGLSLQIAGHYKTEILSADSRQFYREMNIGTAKPSPNQLKSIPHHFINSLSIHEPYSVGKFEEEALKKLEELYKSHDVIVMVGGSGLFIRAVCQGLDSFPEIPASIREKVRNLYEKNGIQALQERLKEEDPVYYAEVDLNNPQRLIRALEVCLSSGETYSGFRRSKPGARDFRCFRIAYDWDRKSLYQRINDRVDHMIESGLPKEAESLFPFRNLPALQTVGYKELFEVISGRLDLEDAVKLIKRNSRRYAKRQVTWFKRVPDIRYFDPKTSISDILHFLDSKISGIT